MGAGLIFWIGFKLCLIGWAEYCKQPTESYVIGKRHPDSMGWRFFLARSSFRALKTQTAGGSDGDPFGYR